MCDVFLTPVLKNLYFSVQCCVSYSVVSNSFVTPMYCNPPGSSVLGILQVRILEYSHPALL